MSLAERHQYSNNAVLNLRSTVLREYDMEDAGWSIIKRRRIFKDGVIERLEGLGKHERNVAVGKLLIDNKTASKEFMAELARARVAFVEDNGIEDYQILAIKRDALFVVGRTALKTEVCNGAYRFKAKNRYSSFYRLDRQVELYYSAWDDRLDVKGIAKGARESQQDFLIKDLGGLVRASERLDQAGILAVLRRYRSKYLSRDLPVETYREMGLNNAYRTRLSVTGSPVYMHNATEGDLDEIDITYNYTRVLIPLISLIL
jgi:hypothetical protein